MPRGTVGFWSGRPLAGGGASGARRGRSPHVDGRVPGGAGAGVGAPDCRSARGCRRRRMPVPHRQAARGKRGEVVGGKAPAGSSAGKRGRGRRRESAATGWRSRRGGGPVPWCVMSSGSCHQEGVGSNNSPSVMRYHGVITSVVCVHAAPAGRPASQPATRPAGRLAGSGGDRYARIRLRRRSGSAATSSPTNPTGSSPVPPRPGRKFCRACTRPITARGTSPSVTRRATGGRSARTGVSRGRTRPPERPPECRASHLRTKFPSFTTEPHYR